jgi:hypothetical protein
MSTFHRTCFVECLVGCTIKQSDARGQRCKKFAVAAPIGYPAPPVLDPAACCRGGYLNGIQQPGLPQHGLAVPGAQDWWHGQRDLCGFGQIRMSLRRGGAYASDALTKRLRWWPAV